MLSGPPGACRPAGEMSDSAFESMADSLLATLEEAIGDHADAELQGGILTVDGDANGVGGTWVLNKHAPTRQIWLSSPRSGAKHYAFDAASGLWQDTRGGGDLLTHLSSELGIALEWRPQ
jgi:frataxin